jgi:CRISPR-associated endonuclease/helicase Cas3
MLPPSRAPDDDIPPLQSDQAYAAWKFPSAALTGVLPQQQPFRNDIMKTTTLAFLPDDDEEALRLHRIEKGGTRCEHDLYIPIEQSLRHDVHLETGPRIDSWGGFDLMTLLAEQADYLELPLRACSERMATVEVPTNEQGWRYHSVLGFSKYKD